MLNGVQNRRVYAKQTSVTVFKGIAIFMVILVHIAQPFSLPGWMKYITKLGQLGCQIFFVLSSYTLCFSIDRKKDTYLYFQKKRWLRIIPGYWSMIFVYLVLALFSLFLFDKNYLNTSLSWKAIFVNVFVLNGIVPGEANNLVVRGGWYVGTSIILYLLMPLLYRLYNYKSWKWQKIRIWFFPFIIMLSSACVMIIASKIDSRLYCANNSFMYFSFVNQLPAFAVGFSLYDWKKNYCSNNKIGAIMLCMVLGVFSVILFHSGLAYAFVFVPTVFAVFFSVVFALVSEKIEKNTSKIRMLEKWGDYSFAVYLFHSLIVYEGSTVLIHIWKSVFNDLSETLLFVLWLPVAYFIIYYIGKLFSKYLSYLDQLIRKRIK